jgi:hypothetical protein
MKKRMTLRLDGFGREALDDYSRESGGTHGTVLHTALRYYLDDPESGRAAWRLPQLVRTAKLPRTLELEIDEDLYRELEEEAQHQEVAPDVLATHAVLHFLTDIDTGRVAARLGDAINRDAEAK